MRGGREKNIHEREKERLRWRQREVEEQRERRMERAVFFFHRSGNELKSYPKRRKDNW